MADIRKRKFSLLEEVPLDLQQLFMQPVQSLKPYTSTGIALRRSTDDYDRRRKFLHGFSQTIQGHGSLEQMQKQAEHVGTETVYDTLLQVNFGPKSFLMPKGDSGSTYQTDTVIIATGAQAPMDWT